MCSFIHSFIVLKTIHSQQSQTVTIHTLSWTVKGYKAPTTAHELSTKDKSKAHTHDKREKTHRQNIHKVVKYTFETFRTTSTRAATQGRIQKMNLDGANSGGLGDESPPAESRGGAPVEGLWDEVPQKLTTFRS